MASTMRNDEQLRLCQQTLCAIHWRVTFGGPIDEAARQTIKEFCEQCVPKLKGIEKRIDDGLKRNNETEA